MATVKPPDPYLVTVLDPELLLVMWSNEADALFSLFHMAVQPVPPITVDEQVFLPLIGIQLYKVRILRCIRPETKRKSVIKAAIRVLPAKTLHGVTAFQKTAVLLIAHQGVQDVFKLALKFLGVQVLTAAFPRFEKTVPVLAHIGPQVADTPGLPRDLHTLAFGIKPFRWGSGPHGQFHYRSHSLSCSFGGFSAALASRSFWNSNSSPARSSKSFLASSGSEK